jgi:prepilin-type N-terminal cleavage/methylation domain-containing protein
MKTAHTHIERTTPSADEVGFSLVELLIAMAVGAVLVAMSVPVLSSAMSRMRMNSANSAISTAISKTRYRSIRNSETYTLAITTPQNTYVVTDINSNVADRAVPLPAGLTINGGLTSVYTYTFCPNGTVYGAGGVCINNLNAPPQLNITYSTRQTNISVSTVGNVTATIIR